MSPIASAMGAASAEIADLTGRIGRAVAVERLGVLDRGGHLPLSRPGTVSPNRACRLIRAADGWIAVNLAREADRQLVPAWLRGDFAGDPWEAITAAARRRSCGDLLGDAALLGLPVGRVGEVNCERVDAPSLTLGAPGPARRGGPLKVVDLSALWAGPLCGAIFAAAGAHVTKVESVRRPDLTRTSTPELFRNLNHAKAELRLDLASAGGQDRLRSEIAAADVLITSARPRAFASLGLSPDDIFTANPSLVWAAITGYGWTGVGATRVAFGDDAAAAGGLVGWTTGGAPRFLGDALADPITGLAATVGALRAVMGGGGVLVDAAMARCAAGAAAEGLKTAA